jgi:hypothetical protein
MDPVIMMKPRIFIAVLALSAGCATGPKPCTAEWVDWKAQRFFDEFARDHRTQIDDLRQATAGLDPSGDKSPAQIASMALVGARVVVLGADFFRNTVPEVNKAVSQCGTAPKATQLFASLLRREGFSPETVDAIEDLGVLLDKER